MIEVDSLETMAEIAIALTGFTGVVSVFGPRPSGGWVGPERLFLQALLNWSLIAVVLGMLPGVVSSNFEDPEKLWLSVSVVFAVVHFVSLAWFLVAVTRLGLSTFRRFEQIITIFGIPVGVLLVACQAAAVAGPLRSHLALVYHLGILWYLLISALAFSFMLFPRGGAPHNEGLE